MARAMTEMHLKPDGSMIAEDLGSWESSTKPYSLLVQMSALLDTILLRF